MRVFIHSLVIGLIGALTLTVLGCTLDRRGTRPPCPSIGDHFYTTNLSERNKAIAMVDPCSRYIDDGVPIAGYLFREKGIFDISSDAVPFYRLYNPGNGDHFYTTSKVEREKALTVHGYIDDGYCSIYEGGSSGCVSIAGYLYPSPKDGTVPLFRLYRP